MKYFVGICGPAGVGKNIFTGQLIRELHALVPLEWGITEDCIAYPAYELVAGLTGMPIVDLMNRTIKDTEWTAETAPQPGLIGVSPRDMLLGVLMQIRREYGEAAPVRGLKLRRADSVFSPAGICVVTDVRTNAEAAEMDYTIELSRDGISYKGGHTESGIALPDMKVRLKTVDRVSMEAMADFRGIAAAVIKALLGKAKA